MVRFFTEDIKFDFKQRLLTKKWLKVVAGSEIRKIGDININ